MKHTSPVKAVLVESLSTDSVFRAQNAAALSSSSSSTGSKAAAAAAAGPVEITNQNTFAACAEYMKITKGKLAKEDFHEVCLSTEFCLVVVPCCLFHSLFGLFYYPSSNKIYFNSNLSDYCTPILLPLVHTIIDAATTCYCADVPQFAGLQMRAPVRVCGLNGALGCSEEAHCGASARTRAVLDFSKRVC